MSVCLSLGMLCVGVSRTFRFVSLCHIFHFYRRSSIGFDGWKMMMVMVQFSRSSLAYADNESSAAGVAKAAGANAERLLHDVLANVEPRKCNPTDSMAAEAARLTM